MGSVLSQTDIYNVALDMLRERPITSLSDGRPQTDWLNRNWAGTRDALLRAHTWNFAITRASLAASSTAPAFGWDVAYDVEPDHLRLLPLRTGGELNGRPIPHGS
jgi:hypothetical protein